MTRESCVKHPARNPTVVLRDDYLRLCDGDYCAAMILSQHEHWHNVKLDSRQQAKEHNQAALRASEEPTQDTELWVYMKQVRMKAQLMGLFGDKAVATAYKMIMDKGFLQKRTNPRFPWDKTHQYMFDVERVQEATDALAPLEEDGDDAEIPESAELQGSRPQKCALDTAELRPPERSSAASETQMCVTLKTSSPKTFSETSSKNLPPPQVPPRPVLEEEELNASPTKQDVKTTGEEASRVEAMIEQIAKLTGTRIEIGSLSPLALECVRREHKDAWAHTLAVLKNKMACDRKPLNPNRYAATVLAKALESPAPPVKVQETTQPAPAPAQAAPAQDAGQVRDAPTLWLRKARHELSGSGAAAFLQKHGRHSALADWEARAREMEAEAAKDN